MADEKKLLERKALDAFLFNNRKLKKYEIDDNERPDFILEKDGYKIGIEHFRADTILNEHTDSESMKFDGKRKKMYEKHHAKLLNDEFDADASAKDIETSINKSLDAASKFAYKAFINNLKDVFEQHAGKVSEYKKKCDEVWFLIDIGIENDHFTASAHAEMSKSNRRSIPSISVFRLEFHHFPSHFLLFSVIQFHKCCFFLKSSKNLNSGSFRNKKFLSNFSFFRIDNPNFV